MEKHTVIRNHRAFTVVIHSDTNADVYAQAVNPKTGQGWQAARNLQHFEGEGAKARAFVAWLKASRTLQEVQS
jgi:hypothetical protein